MKKNLLRVVQTYLDYVDGFQVDSIFDSDEALQAATIAEHVYYTLLDKNRSGIPYQRRTLNLTSSGDINAPNVLFLPDSVARIHESKVYYSGEEVCYLRPDAFLERYQQEVRGDKFQEVKIGGVKYYINKTKQPEFFTSFDDYTLIFDSFDEEEDTTLQSSKSVAYVSDHPVFLLQDDFVIPLPDHMHSGYQDLVTQECCEALRDIQKPQVARRANAFLSKLQKSSDRVGEGLFNHKKIRYGRR